MSDDRLRWELTALGFEPGPITDSTRDVLKRKLQRLRTESTYRRPINGSTNGDTNGHGSLASEDYDEEDDEGQIHNGDEWNEPEFGVPVQHGPARRMIAPRSWTPGAASSVQARHAGNRLIQSLSDDPRSLGSFRGASSSTFSPTIFAQDSENGLPGQIGRRRFADENTARSWAVYQHENNPFDTRSRAVLNSASNEQWTQQWRSNRTRRIEYYLSRLLRVLSVALFIAFIGILAVKSGILSSQQESKLLPFDCDGRVDQFCKENENKITFRILSELYDFLSKVAGRYDCGNNAALSSKCVPISTARAHITNVSGYPPEKFDKALEWVLKSDKHFGIWVKDEDKSIVTTRDHAFCLESSRPRFGVFCRIKHAFYTTLSTLFLAVFGMLLLWFFLIFLRYRWRKLEEEEKQMFDMVEKIIDVVKNHYNEFLNRAETFPYVGIVHVRDTLILPHNRLRLKKIWDRAVRFIEDHESRLRTESQRVAGADLRVWRWTTKSREYSGFQSMS